MFVLTLKDQQDDGAYAVQDRHGHKVLFLFSWQFLFTDSLLLPNGIVPK